MEPGRYTVDIAFQSTDLGVLSLRAYSHSYRMAAGMDPLSSQVRENGQAWKGHSQGQTTFQESWRVPQSLGVVRFP